VNTAVNLCVLDQLGDHQLLKEDPVTWICFLNGNGCAEKRVDSRSVFCAAEVAVYRMRTAGRRRRFAVVSMQPSKLKTKLDLSLLCIKVHAMKTYDALDSVEWSPPRPDNRASGTPLHGRQETQSRCCGEEKDVLRLSYCGSANAMFILLICE
jgi:hypothetical protein